MYPKGTMRIRMIAQVTPFVMAQKEIRVSIKKRIERDYHMTSSVKVKLKRGAVSKACWRAARAQVKEKLTLSAT